MESIGIIKTGVGGKYYEIYKCGPFTEDNIVNDLIHEKGSIVISQYGLSQIAGIFPQQDGTKTIPTVKILYGNIAPMASVMSIAEFMKHNPILIKLKEVEAILNKEDDSYLNKMSNIFPFFRVYKYNLLEEGESK